MEIYYFFLLFVMCFSYTLSLILISLFVKKLSSTKISIFRQVGIFLCGIPLLFFLDINFFLIFQNFLVFLLSAVFGALNIFLTFYSFKTIEVSITNFIKRLSIVIFGFLIGVVFFSESITINFIIGLILIFISFYFILLEKKVFKTSKSNNLVNFVFPILAGLSFSISMYFFKLYPKDFHPLLNAYILETIIGTLIIIFSLLKTKNIKKIKETFSIEIKDLIKFILFGLLILFGSFLSYIILNSIEFKLFSLLSTILSLILTIILSNLILKEEITKRKIIGFLIAFIGIFFIVFI